MKNRVKYIIGILLILALGFIVLSDSNIRVKADSGWDSDYDSGWDSDWGSDWDSDWGSSWDNDYSGSSYSGGSYSGSSSNTDPTTAIIIFILIYGSIILYLVLRTTRKSKYPLPSRSTTSYTIMKSISEEEVRQYLPDFNKNEFLEKAYNIFIDVQNAWSEFNYEELRKNLSDELFNTYKSQLKTLSLKKQKNIMSDFNSSNIDITNVNNNDGKITLIVELIISFYDYVVDANDNVVRGTKSRKITNHYSLTYIASISKNNKSNKCPNCNAPLDNVASNTCPYCKSTIVSEHYDWVLSKKEIKR